MKTTIDAAGRIVVPKAIREAAGIRPGIPLEIRWQDGKIEIEPTTLPVRLERRGRFTVIVPLENVPMLTTDQVEDMKERIQRERESGL